jgi:hypothetical protein
MQPLRLEGPPQIALSRPERLLAFHFRPELLCRPVRFSFFSLFRHFFNEFHLVDVPAEGFRIFSSKNALSEATFIRRKG